MLGKRKHDVGQTYLGLSMNLVDYIDTNDIAFIIRNQVNQLDLIFIEELYGKSGRASYPFEDMLCAFMLGITTLNFSYRELEQACKYDIRFMWLMDFKKPDHATFHRFHKRLIGHEQDLLKAQIKWLIDSGNLNPHLISIDGTKIESVANKYSSTYRGTVGYHESNMETKVYDAINILIDNKDNSDNNDNSDEDDDNNQSNPTKSTPATYAESTENTNQIDDQLPDYIVELITRENPNALKKFTNPKSINKNYIPTLSQIDLAKIAEFIATLTKEQINQYPKVKELSKMIDGYFVRKGRYTNQREILGDRNSYSKTDEDAVFMRLKEDSFDTVVLHPAYNYQLAVCGDFMLGGILSNSASDTRQLPDVVNYLNDVGILEQCHTLLADAGYGSLENYTHLDNRGIKHLIPYMTWRYEKKRKHKNNPCTPDKFEIFSPEVLICPNKRTLEYIETKTTTSKEGFETHKQIYECKDCSGCQLREHCLKKKQKNKRLYLDLEWLEYKMEVNEKFQEEEMAEAYKERTRVEHGYAKLKYNFKMRRFRNHGLEMNNLVLAIYSMAINCSALASLDERNAKQGTLDILYNIKLNVKKCLFLRIMAFFNC